MAIRILPFRQYDENDVINMFAFDGQVNASPSETHSDAGMIVQVASGDVTGGYNPTQLAANSDLLGSSNYPHVARNYYPEVPLKIEACDGTSGKAIGVTLAQTLTHDENGENLLRYPQKKDELFAVTSGEAVPVASKGIFTLAETAFSVAPTKTHLFVKAAASGKLTSQAAPDGDTIGKILAIGERESQNGNADQFAGKYVVVKLDC